ncbi:MAG: hypothetical protein Q9213_007914 [Squamulea squamosa]
MAFQRPPLSVPASTQQILRIFAPSFSKSTSYQSPHKFHSSTHFRPISRRKLVTATSYRPHSFESYPLHPPPAPPRNAGIPDSSIAGTKPEVHDTRPPDLVDEPIWTQQRRQEESQNISVPESEAQKSKPVTEPPPRKSKLRARKAAMTVTPAASAQLRNLLSQPDPKLIRVGVKNRGCSGLAYNLEYVEKPGMFDETVEQDGVKVLIDSKALFSIIGSEMDWVEDKLNQRFVFRNPNIKEQCGCGESFMV